MGARGNSGVILSQLLRGIAEGLSAARPAAPGPTELAEALAIADRLAREAVMRPVEGTILTVARGAAEGARAAADAGRVAGRRGRGLPGRGGRGAGPDPVPPARAGAGRGGRRRRDRLPAALRRPARACSTAADARAPRAAGPVPGRPRVPGDRGRRPESADPTPTARRPPLRGDVPARGARRDHPSFKEVWAGLGRLHRGGRGRRPVELPHPHR